MTRRVGWAVVVLWMAACSGAEPDVGELAAQVAPGDECTEQGCGENSPVMASFPITELSLAGELNQHGFYLEMANGLPKLIKGGHEFELFVQNGTITGRRANITHLSGNALIDAWIPVWNGTTRYAIKIRNVRTMPFFLPRTGTVETYHLQWSEAAVDNFRDLCANMRLLRDERRVDPEGQVEVLMGMEIWAALVFEGDRFHFEKKLVREQADDRWISIGCAGNTISKLYLTHNTVHTHPAVDSWRQRQAALKMYVADYCGNGTAFTVARQKLVWRTAGVGYLHPPRMLEARWNEHGAMCLHEPRMAVPTTPLGPLLFPDIEKQIALTCSRPPPCKDLDPEALAGAEFVSANP